VIISADTERIHPVTAACFECTYMDSVSLGITIKLTYSPKLNLSTVQITSLKLVVLALHFGDYFH
jgi:hypothetical protein